MTTNFNSANQTPQKIYDFIKSYQQKHRMPPTIQEIAESLGISTTTVVYWRDVLARDGMLTYQPGRARTLVLNDQPDAGRNS